MPDKTPPAARPASAAAPTSPAAPGGTTLPVRRHPGHRGTDVRDTVAEMAAKAHEISLEAGSKMAAAMKDVINAAAGISAFSIESARDLAQFMVRRSQMTQDEAEKLLASAEEASAKNRKAKKPAATSAAAPAAKKSAPKKAAKPKAAAKPKKAAKKPVPKK